VNIESGRHVRVFLNCGELLEGFVLAVGPIGVTLDGHRYDRGLRGWTEIKTQFVPFTAVAFFESDRNRDRPAPATGADS
jgi:hypothetical protein